MLRSILCSLTLLAASIVPQMTPAKAAANLLVLTRTSCDMYGRCFEFSGPNDALVSDSSDLWQRDDPLALAHGPIGDRVEELADE